METKPKKLFINQGDSGGPLICSVGLNEYLFGILSSGPTNGRMYSFLFPKRQLKYFPFLYRPLFVEKDNRWQAY